MATVNDVFDQGCGRVTGGRQYHGEAFEKRTTALERFRISPSDDLGLRHKLQSFTHLESDEGIEELHEGQ